MNEIGYFVMGGVSVVLVWSLMLIIIAYVDRKSLGGFDEWMKYYDTKDLKNLQRTFHKTEEEESPLGIGAMSVAVGGDSAYCFVTGVFIGADVIDSGKARFTNEFDAWVSEKGQEILFERGDNEAKIILEEWEENTKTAI